MIDDLSFYKILLSDIKNRIRQGQLKANLAANAELLATYWDIGKMIHERQQLEGWGKGVIPRLAIDLKNELAEERGFSERNISNMLAFYREYSDPSILQLPVANLGELNSKTISQKTDGDSILALPVAKLESSITKRSVSQLNNSTDQQLFVSIKQHIN